VRFAVLLDGTLATAARQARALSGFLSQGLRGAGTGETLVFYCDEADRERLVELSPTRDVRLVRTTPHDPEQMVASLAALARDGEIRLFLAAGGAAGTELVTRLACRTGGAALTEALSIELGSDGLRGRRNVYSNHLVGRFEASARPFCVSLDGCWNDAREPSASGRNAAPCAPTVAPRESYAVPPGTHEILSDTDESGGGTAPFSDIEWSAPATTADLAESRFLVVAGYGAGSREATERIAAAARRMAADFGVSRPVAMNAWAPLDRLIGVSGARSAPVLCIVVGASGAPALSWGIERAGFIVAINPDDHAPIVRNADAVVLDDGVAVIEELAAIVAARRRGV
jgi:electron transfer flavoprotein alpha subunit